MRWAAHSATDRSGINTAPQSLSSEYDTGHTKAVLCQSSRRSLFSRVQGQGLIAFWGKCFRTALLLGSSASNVDRNPPQQREAYAMRPVNGDVDRVADICPAEYGVPLSHPSPHR